MVYFITIFSYFKTYPKDLVNFLVPTALSLKGQNSFFDKFNLLVCTSQQSYFGKFSLLILHTGEIFTLSIFSMTSALVKKLAY